MLDLSGVKPLCAADLQVRIINYRTPVFSFFVDDDEEKNSDACSGEEKRQREQCAVRQRSSCSWVYGSILPVIGAAPRGNMSSINKKLERPSSLLCSFVFFAGGWGREGWPSLLLKNVVPAP